MGAAFGTCCLAESVCCLGTQGIMCCGRGVQCSGAIGYPILVFTVTVVCLVFRYLLAAHFDSVYNHFHKTSLCFPVEDMAARHACYGNQFVYRMSFSLVLFFSMMLLLVACFRKAAHDGAWMLKNVVVVMVFFASCWIDDSAMVGFASVCLWGSAAFIFLQILALLDWVYAWNEHWRALAEEDSSYFHNLFWTTMLSYGMAVAFIVLAIVQFGAGGCTFAIAQISCTCVVCFLFSLLSVSGIADHGSLLCSAMVTLYCSYYCWSTLTGMAPDITDSNGERCNTLISDDGTAAMYVNVTVGLILTCFGLVWSIYSTAEGLSLDTTSEARPNNGKASGSTYAELSGSDDVVQEVHDWEFGGVETIKPLMGYHLTMILATMFMTMTIVNWDVSSLSPSATLQSFGTGTTVVIAKTLALWLTVVLYLWTIVGQRIMGMCGVERDFDFAA